MSPYQYSVHTSPVSHLCHMPHSSHAAWFYHLNNIWWGVQIIKLLLCNLIHSLFGPNIFLTTLFSNTLLSPRSSLSVSTSFTPIQHNRHNYSFVYLNFIFLDGKLEDKKFYTEWQHIFPDFNLLLISSWMKFRFDMVVPSYLNCSTLSKDLLLIFMLWFCPACLSQNMAKC